MSEKEGGGWLKEVFHKYYKIIKGEDIGTREEGGSVGK
jgi:hypothetical protein